ncbi:MAG: HNH endonuclease, partial [Chlamydiia bacterium]|nr:HNH endonuclease [Chlamydiia bacterium]
SICGSIDAFLEDPSRLRLGRPNSNFDWMRRVSPQEAKACRDKMLQWAESDKKPSGKGSIGEWIFKPSVARRGAVNEPLEARDLVSAKTPGAAQRNWRIPTEFPCCPSSGEERPISAYLNNLTPGAIFSRNKISTSVVLDAAVTDDDQAVLVICDRPEKDAIKPWTVATVTIEGSLFVHTSLGTFFSEEGAKKEFCLARGHQWTGDDTIDNYC